MLFDRDYMQGGRRLRPGFFRTQQSMIMPLIWANVAVFVLQMLTETTAPGLTAYIALQREAVSEFQVWRFGTYMFAHGGFWHIFVNMWGLHLFGRNLERTLGPSRFLNLYFISGLVGGFAWTLCNWNTLSYCVGASGAVFGVTMAAAMLYPNERIMLLFPPIPMTLKTFMIVFGGIEVITALQASNADGIAHMAHLGGGFAGYFYVKKHYNPLWSPFSFFEELAAQWRRHSEGEAWRRGFKLHKNDDAPDDDGRPSVAEVDRILDKIGSQGMGSLTSEERSTLERCKRYQRGNKD